MELSSDIKRRIEIQEEIILDIGCGNRKHIDSAIGIDVLDLEGVDLVGDVFQCLKAFPDNSVDKIYSSHFIEHIDELELYLKESYRILKGGGILESIVPHFSNAYYYSDYTHKRFFGLYSMSYLAKDNIYKRKVPQYGFASDFIIKNIRLNFKSQFRIRNVLRRWVGKLVNLNTYFQEFYEENLTSFISCYEIEFYLEKQVDSK